MPASVSEELLLSLALRSGLLSAEDVANTTSPGEMPARAVRFGPRLDLLIARGRLTVATVERLVAELRGAETLPPPQRPTQSDSLPAAQRLGAATLDGPGATEAVELARTMDSAAAGMVPSTVSISAFPVPSWTKYEFLGVLGRGGMGAVYKGRDRRLGRIVALKFIHGDDPAQIQRFMQEARAQARLEHPNICKVLEVGTVDNRPYIAMQFVDGLPLDQASRAMTLVEKVRVMKDAAEAMHAAHEQGVIHRDLKPSNILVTRSVALDGTLRFSPVVMDFGLARDSDSANGLTESGAVMGTPAYMSPEQARGEARRLERRSDVYSLGATLYDVLVDRPPFDDEVVLNILLQVMNDAPRPLRTYDATIPEALELIVGKCLNKEPEQRYETAKALADDLARFLNAQQIVARSLGYGYRLRYWTRRNKALAAVVVALVVSLVGLTSFGIYTRAMNLRKAWQAQKEAELAKRLGQSVKDLEWLMRTAYLLPLHDTEYEKGLLRQGMLEITTELGAAVEVERLGAYVLGRGHLALHEWGEAHTQLRKAERLGYKDAELGYALGRVLGELYSRAVEEARKSGDKGFFEKRRKELEAEYLVPAQRYLQASRNVKSVSTNYVEALLDFYSGHHDAALLHAYLARRQAPWLYEAAKLEGDVFMTRALADKDRGDSELAQRNFAEAVSRYEQAAAIGHSDPQVHEAIAEAWIRQEELAALLGKDPKAELEQALAAADRALEAAPRESSAHTKKAFAILHQAHYAQNHGDAEGAIKAYQRQIALGKQAIAIHPDDAYAHEITGIAYSKLAELYVDMRKPIQDIVLESYKYLDQAVRINPLFPWAYNDYGIALLVSANSKVARNEDPKETVDKLVYVTSRAIALDPNYLFAYNTLSSGYGIMGKWQVEHGNDPRPDVGKALDALATITQKNKEYIFAYGNAGLFSTFCIIFELLNGKDIRATAQQTIDYFNKMLLVDKNIYLAHQGIAVIYHLLAHYAVENHQDPTQSIDKGLQQIKECYRIQSGFADCQGAEAQLFTVQANWKKQQGAPFLPTLEKAHKLALLATQQAAGNEELLLILAEVCYEQAAALLARKQAPGVALREGLAAVTQALALAKDWPRALAVQGALFALQAQTQDGAPRIESSRRAKESLSSAFAGNALLARRFGHLAEASAPVAQRR